MSDELHRRAHPMVEAMLNATDEPGETVTVSLDMAGHLYFDPGVGFTYSDGSGRLVGVSDPAGWVEELGLLRALRRAVDRLDTLMLFHQNTTPGQASHLGHRVEVSIESWDNLMDAVGDLALFEHERDERAP